MKKTRFDGHDKKIIELLNQHDKLSTIEVANYLMRSRSYTLAVLDNLVKLGKIKKELSINNDKYYANTFLFSLNKNHRTVEKIIDCTKGGKAKKAPYETTHARIPTEVKPLVENISNTYKVLKENNDIEGITKLLNNSSSEYLTKQIAHYLLDQLVAVIEDQQKRIDATIDATQIIIDMIQDIACCLDHAGIGNQMERTRRQLNKTLNN